MKQTSSTRSHALSIAIILSACHASTTLFAQTAGSPTAAKPGPAAAPLAHPPAVRFLIPQPAPYLGTAPRLSDLLCEGLSCPLGLDVPQPRLSWKVEPAGTPKIQAAYRILVASNLGTLASDIADIWDSDKVESSESANILYAGRPLVENEECFWKVKIWDAEGRDAGWSEPARWTVGKLSANGWTAEWIGFDAARQRTMEPAPMGGAQWITQSADNAPLDPKAPAVLLGEFEIPAATAITSAVLYSAAEGRARIFLNGQAALNLDTADPTRSDKIVTPAHVKQILRPGKNTMRVELTPALGDPQGKRFIARLSINLADGTTLEHVTDGAWRTVSAPGTDWSSRPIDLAPLPRVQTSSSAPDPGSLEIPSVFLPPASYLRGTFTLTKPVQRAQLYTSTLGASDFYINGRCLQQKTAPLRWTNFQKQVHTRVFDATDLLQEGDNVIGAILADGWFCGYTGTMQPRDRFGTTPRLRAELLIEFVDGSKMIEPSSSEWKASTGALQHADPALGELYDARAEQPKWSTPSFDASLWAPVITGAKEGAPPSRSSLKLDPVPFAELPPINTKQTGENTWILDLGQQIKGTYQLNIQEAAGTAIRLRFARSLNAEGALELPAHRDAFAEDTYICNGSGTECYSPRFSIRHYRFVEISGITHKPGEEAFYGVALTHIPVGEDLTEEAKIRP